MKTDTTTAQPEVKVPTKEELIEKHGTKSAAIRAMTSEGMDRSTIAKILDIRYQHVRNVQVTLLKKDIPAK